MITMMTDPDQVILSAFLFRFIRFIHPFMPSSTRTFYRNVPPCNLSHIILPCPILVFHSHRSKFVRFFPLLVDILAIPNPPLLLPPSPFSLCAHLSAVLLPLLPLLHPSSQQPHKKTCNLSHPALLPSFFASKHAYTHLRSIIYVSITPGGIYLAPKRRIR